MRYAVINNSNIVENIIIIENPEVWTQNTLLVLLNENERCAIGWIYDSNLTPRFIFVPIQAVFSWTSYQFLLRFTVEERAAFRAAALTDPNVADFQQLAQAAQEVISNDPMTVAGMNYLVSVNLLTEQRKNEILGLT
jgi:hypothetical protein